MRDFIVTPLPEQDYTARVRLPIESMLAIQARQSTKKQAEDNRESYEAQTRMHYKRALRLGWQGDAIMMFIENKRKDGTFIDASGTSRIDQRPTMQEIWYHVEHDIIKAIMTRGVDRLFRHIDMVEPAQFAKLCKEHHCLIITDTAILDLNRPDDYKKFLADAQAGADYLQHIKMMLRYKLEKALRGEYDGRNVPAGFILVNEQYHIYEPHAQVVRWLFRRYRELSGNFSFLMREVAQRIADQGYLFPPFADERYTQMGRSGDGYIIKPKGLKGLLTNVVYIGWWLVYETVDKGKETEHRVLRAKIEYHHPAIPPVEDFWYAYERLTEENAPRSRYSKVGTVSCNALLGGIVTSDKSSVYVSQRAEEPDTASYVMSSHKQFRGSHFYGSIYVKELDQLFSSHLLEKLEEGKRIRDTLEPAMRDGWDDLDAMLATRLIDVAKMQEIATAGIDSMLAQYQEEAASLDNTLHYGAKKLPPAKIEEYAERLARLSVSISELTRKKNRAQKTAEELAAFTNKLDDVPAVWKGLGIEKQRRFVSLVTEKITLTKPSPNWLQLTIQWLWPDMPLDILYIWQRGSRGEAWTDDENSILRTLYPHADRGTILQALPSRSWSAILQRAVGLELSRAYQRNDNTLHRLLSVEDATFMAQAGIVFDKEDPYVRYWVTSVRNNDTSSRRRKAPVQTLVIRFVC
jgi:hypothetical protein